MTGSGSWRSKCGLGWHFLPVSPARFEPVFQRVQQGNTLTCLTVCLCLVRKVCQSVKSVRSDRICASLFPLINERVRAAMLQLLQVFQGGVCVTQAKAQAQRKDSRLPGGSSQVLPRLKGCVTMWYWRIIFAR